MVAQVFAGVWFELIGGAVVRARNGAGSYSFSFPRHLFCHSAKANTQPQPETTRDLTASGDTTVNCSIETEEWGPHLRWQAARVAASMA